MNYSDPLLRQVNNISTQSVQELFFVIGAFVEPFTVMIWLSFLGCDVQQERNRKSIICKKNVISVMVRQLNSKP